MSTNIYGLTVFVLCFSVLRPTGERQTCDVPQQAHSPPGLYKTIIV